MPEHQIQHSSWRRPSSGDNLLPLLTSLNYLQVGDLLRNINTCLERHEGIQWKKYLTEYVWGEQKRQLPRGLTMCQAEKTECTQVDRSCCKHEERATYPAVYCQHTDKTALCIFKSAFIIQNTSMHLFYWNKLYYWYKNIKKLKWNQSLLFCLGT